MTAAPSRRLQPHSVGAWCCPGWADLLTDGPRSSQDLAATLGAHEDTLRRVLRGMVRIGLLIEDEDGRFGLDELGQLLRTNEAGRYLIEGMPATAR